MIIIEIYVILVQYTLYYSSLLFLIMIGISTAFIYFGGYLTNSNIGVININPGTGTIIY